MISNAELKLVEEFFGDESHRQLQDLHQKFHASIPNIENVLYEEVVERGLFEENPEKVRSRYEGYATLFMLPMGCSCAFAFLTNLTGEVSVWWCIPSALALIGLALSMTSSDMPRKTNKGREAASKWKAFRRYLENLEEYGDLEEKKAICCLLHAVD